MLLSECKNSPATMILYKQIVIFIRDFVSTNCIHNVTKVIASHKKRSLVFEEYANYNISFIVLKIWCTTSITSR